jgi:hypothetical protein
MSAVAATAVLDVATMSAAIATSIDGDGLRRKTVFMRNPRRSLDAPMAFVWRAS